jgi:epoxyqueuosine reductase
MPAPDSASSLTSAAGFTRERARVLARDVGFSEAGVVSLPYAEEARDANRFEQWIGAGRAGTMGYLSRVAENGRLVRARVAVPYPWARSALVCFALYNAAQPLSTDAAPEGAAWIARYAWSSRIDAQGKRVASDYHKVLLKRLKALDARLHAEFGEFESRAYVDTGPVVERSLAVAAGLGWTGKNTCLIHPQLGSFGFLAVLLTSLEVSEEAREQGSEGASQRVGESAEEQGSGVRDQGTERQGTREQGNKATSKQVNEAAPLLVPDRCGTCTRCLEACPTGALVAPYQMDATRCIAYLTIEHKGPIDEELAAGMGRQVFGCDICQDVCPWNRKALRNGFAAMDSELSARSELINPTLEWLASLDEQAFESAFNGSPVRRAGFNGLRRNVAIAMGNGGLRRYKERLQAWAFAADEGLRAAARWALGRLDRGASG